MTEQGQTAQTAWDLDETLTALLRQVQEGTEAEQLLKYLDSVLDKFKDAVFSALQMKLDSTSLYNINSVCVAFKRIQNSLREASATKAIAETELKKQEEKEG